MDSIPWYWLVAFGVFCISALVELIWVFNAAKDRRPLGISGLIVTVYFIVMISWVMWFRGIDYLPIRTGMITAIGLCMLGLLHIADIVARPK